MEDSRLKTIAVIPAYNEEHSIARVILRTKQHVDTVFVCDDGSNDMTFEIANELGARVVRHSMNRGKGEALRTLYKEITELDPDIIVTVDGDGQHDPDQIPLLVKPIEAGEFDVVVGSRYVYGGMMDAPRYRTVGLRLINFLYKKLAGVQIKDTQCGFRAYSRKAFEYLMQGDEKGYGTEGEQLVLASGNGFRMMEVPISVKYNGLGATSKKSPLLHGVDLIFTLFRLVVGRNPLRYLGLPGIGVLCVGAILELYLFSMFNATGFLSVPIAILAVGSLMLGVLGIASAIILHVLKGINEKLNGLEKSYPT